LSPRKREPKGALPEGAAYLGAPDLARLLELVSHFGAQSIVVLGDLVVDEFVSGAIARVSREAPVLILRHRHTELRPGGGANAVNNLADLGARVWPVGVVGDDAAGRALIEYFRAKNVSVSGIFRVPGYSTTTKTRFLAGWTHTTEQQVLRVDRETGAPWPAAILEKMRRKARKLAKQGGALLVSDYGLGAVTPEVVRSLPAKLITLDSRYALLEYGGAKITAATPNEPEIEALYHVPVGGDPAQLDQLAARTLRQMDLQALLVTRGKDGMMLFERGKRPLAIPIHGTDQALDVTGAGDTVIAVFTLALVAGGTFAEAAALANYAGGIVVMKKGTATVTPQELEAAIRSDATTVR
jgi:D-glycero-beta-D-manno-heptose-7-phosphate kinase